MRCCGAALALVVGLFALAGGSELCPRGCLCGAGIERTVECHRPGAGGGQLSVRSQQAQYLIIECEDLELSCEDVPVVDFGRNESIPSIGLEGCSLGPGLDLACALRRLSVAGVHTLTIKFPPNGLQLRPEHLQGLDTVTKFYVYLEDNDELVVPGAVLAQLPALRSLTLAGGRLRLDPAMFSGTPHLRTISISAHLTHLPTGLFTNLQHLHNLYLHNNKLENITADAFEGLAELKELELARNQLRELDGEMLATLPKLEVLSAYYNPLKRLGPLGPLQHLKKIQIFENLDQLTVEPRALAGLPALTSVNLKSCNIASLPADVFSNSTALQTLDLQKNKLELLPAEVFAGLSQVQTLFLNDNVLRELPKTVFWPLKSLHTLRLDGNKLRRLPDEMLEGLAALRVLNAERNQLQVLTGRELSGAHDLEELLLTHNNLTFEDGQSGYLSLEGWSPLNGLRSLVAVRLAHNRLAAVPPDAPLLLLRLRTLDLAHNRIAEIDDYGSALNFLSSNVTVDLSYNNITSVFLTPPSPETGPAPASRVLLTGNPLDCTCAMYHLALRLRGHLPQATEPAFDPDTAYCATPPELNGRRLLDVPLDRLQCSVPKEQCVEDCSCVVRPASSALELDCEGRDPNITLPAPENFGSKFLDLRLRRRPASLFALPPVVRSLNLSGIGVLEAPTGPVAPTLKVLDLSTNRLTSPPMELLEANLSIYLAGNPFVCDCWHSKELAFVQLHSDRIGDYDIVACDTKALVAKLDVDSLCSTVRASIAGGLLALLGLIIAAVAALVYRYWPLIRMYLQLHGWCLWCVDYFDDLDDEREYDAFLSFSHEDEAFVIENLLPGLEAGPRPFKVCIHVRDWIPGEWIPAQIARSVDQSRRTIVVLSKNFLKSIWGRLEFRAANMSAVKERRSRVIVVLLEDVSGHEELDAELKAYLATNTYLKWGDPLFWDRLRYALPPRRDEAAVRRAGDKLAKKFMPGKELVVMKNKKGDVEAGKVNVGVGKGGIDTQLTPEGKIINAAIKAPPV